MDFLLPIELLVHISSYLDTKQSLRSFCETSKVCALAAEEFLYRDITFVRHKCQNISNTKIERYCTRATFAFGSEQDPDMGQTEWSITARSAEIVPSNAGDDELFQFFVCLRKVRELVIKGNRKINIGQYARPAHGFPNLETLRLENSSMQSLDLYRFAPFLQYPSLTSLHGSPLTLNLPDAIEPNSLALHTISLSASALPLRRVKYLFEACRSLQRFEFRAQDGVPAMASVMPGQLVTLLARHKETLQHLVLDYGQWPRPINPSPIHGLWIIGNRLNNFCALNTLIVEYGDFFRASIFAASVPAHISREILPPSIRTLKVAKCPPTSTTERSLRSVVDHMQRHPVLNNVTIEWDCQAFEKDMIDPAALQVIAQAVGRGLAIQTTYLDEMDEE
ncbi:hypothetical protein K505DRAFT_99753 [Melanomma pulvis-pyrius CBS 109.77]|uniref:F-box domain-containing protein n=1 Tax=Melanomma pulvis-pyrius CBS 109.77 TaxID=1314802 RepID=A0A6A6WYM7_9PLEO|nr:hypothetical protein K505DRAFT_99753 [Melanomma pulvis-pyrius CBS 109.77]